ncbi:60S ribosome subunit biogenesis protein NIP7 homolog [Cylas formicarius]|uniref:60S ribosome subunit biogenesis protein NIP7 homolog n=1 Tax=Cylas formicarius TaxID=197179 RepID=UPI002958A103|nr:60S ribosome subunit biogenesis protein NIP7 homolog [Cylas formicarius]
MKRLNEERTKVLFEKLAKYIGPNIKLLIQRPDGLYCFREKKNRVYYVSETILKLASTIPDDNLICMGTCFGKFTKSGKFRLDITALNYLAPYAQCKIWLKPSAEQQFLYGNHVTKAGLGRISENVEKYNGVLVYSMSDLPLGFGVAARSTAECKLADPLASICFHQADIGEYIRSEQDLFTNLA